MVATEASTSTHVGWWWYSAQNCISSCLYCIV